MSDEMQNIRAQAHKAVDELFDQLRDVQTAIALAKQEGADEARASLRAHFEKFAALEIEKSAVFRVIDNREDGGP